MSKRKIGYWWVKRPEGEEVVYWTGSEVQIFGSDATLREAEVEWLDQIIPPSGRSTSTDLFASIKQRREFFDRNEAAYRRDVANGTPVESSPVKQANDGIDSSAAWAHQEATDPHVSFLGDAAPAGVVLPPGYGMYEDWEEHGTYQTRLMPWAGRWTDSTSEAAKDAWAHHAARLKFSLKEPKVEKRIIDTPRGWEWGTTAEILAVTSASRECTRGLIRRASVDGVRLAIEVVYLDGGKVGHWQRVEQGREHEIDAEVLQALLSSREKAENPPVAVTLIPYDPRHGESATIMPARSTNEEQWRPGHSKAKP